MRAPARRAGRPGTALALGLLMAAAGGGGAGVLAQARPADARTPADAERPAVDGRIREADLQHDSRDDLYRTPTGAVPAGTPVTIRLRAAAGDLSGAQIRLTDHLSRESVALPLERVAGDPAGGVFGYDFWQVRLPAPDHATILDYTLVAVDGGSVRHLSDDRALDGGTGQIGREAPRDRGWQITWYDPEFVTPEWARGAVVYQIFPDRFENGDPSNDPSPQATPEASGPGRFRHGDVYGNPILPKAWDERPEGYCRAYQGVECGEAPLGRDFFGGDLAGITSRLGYLADLGVTVLYLNPIFAAPSNHRYDTSSYEHIDPDLGTLKDFETLVSEARVLGIRVVLDGVFNHVSSDSPWFDRMARYPELGACESAASPFRDWFTFRRPGPAEPAPCAPSREGDDDTYYVGWFGFDTIPELREIEAVADLVSGPRGVVRTWLERGIAGWRLDVSDSLSHESQAAIRGAARSVDGNAIVIAEQWGDSTPWLVGDQADSTMNYRFRRAVIGLVNGATADPDGSIGALTPSGFASAMLGVREDYPPPAWEVLLNLVDSHDTSRILWTLTPGADNDVAKSDPAALEAGKASLRLVAALQLTFPGMASIYYGDEVGLTGHDDPDDRRPYPWGNEDRSLYDFYRTLAFLRADHPALRHGDLEFIHADDATGTLAYLRRADDGAVAVALNVGFHGRRLDIDVAGRLPDEVELSDVLGGTTARVTAGRLGVTLGPRSVAVLVSTAGIDLAAPPAPDGIEATATRDGVELAWEGVPGAAAYEVWRSPLSGGGYRSLGVVASTAWSDTTVRHGVGYHYVVTSLDELGNRSARSAEVFALPRLSVLDLSLDGLSMPGSDAVAPHLERVISALDGDVDATLRLVVDVDPERAAEGVRAEVGMGPAGSDPRHDASWTWWPAQPLRSDGDALLLRGGLLPEAVGSWWVMGRASTDGGATWSYADLHGGSYGPDPSRSARLEVVPGPDTVAPSAPARPELVDVAPDRVRLRWAPSGAPDVHRYLVLRGPAAEGPFERIGATGPATFTDRTVTAGAAYVYRVVVQDTSFNSSPPSEALVVDAAERMVQVTFTVSVPGHTTPDDTIFIAGDFGGWDPGGTPMTRVDAVTWSITLTFKDQASPQYKYTRGSWEAVEKDAGCGEIPNRTLLVTYGSDGRQEVRDEVGKWRDLDACG